MNPIQILTQSRIRQLLEQSKSVSVVNHDATVGHLRESFLIDFLRDMLPKKLSLNTGVICDATGKISRQLDIIITDEIYLPRISFEGRNSIVPIESALMFAEVKSTLSTSHLEQINEQYKDINQFNYSKDSKDKEKTIVGVHGLILAYDCNIKEKTLSGWLKSNEGIIAICVINKFSMLKLSANKIEVVKSENYQIEFFETLVFIGKLYQALIFQSSKRDFMPTWESYMQGWKK